MKDLVKEEVEQINQTIVENKVDHPLIEDPSNEIIVVLDTYLGWYNHVRQPMTTIEDMVAIAKETSTFQWMLQKVFPNKSGKKQCVPDVSCVLCATHC